MKNGDGSLEMSFGGALDALIEYDDGSFGVVDFKTISISDKLADRYSPQLHTYAFGLEEPAAGFATMGPVTTIGLLCFQPAGLQEIKGRMYFEAAIGYVPIERDADGYGFICNQLAQLLAGDIPPSGDSCRVCSKQR